MALPYILYCTRGGMMKKIMGPSGHCFKVEADSPLGEALTHTRMPGNGPYVTLSALPQFRDQTDMGPFQYLNLDEPCLHPLLNCGKEWVFRTIFTTGQDIISDKTGATMQSFQTRMRLNSRGHFDIITHISACRGGECYSFNIVNHFALVPEQTSFSGLEMSQSEAKSDFIRDIRMAMKHVNQNPKFIAPPTPEFMADAFYPDAEIPCPPGCSRFPSDALSFVLGNR